jgi:hypothetical protein
MYQNRLFDLFENHSYESKEPPGKIWGGGGGNLLSVPVSNKPTNTGAKLTKKG